MPIPKTGPSSAAALRVWLAALVLAIVASRVVAQTIEPLPPPPGPYMPAQPAGPQFGDGSGFGSFIEEMPQPPEETTGMPSMIHPGPGPVTPYPPMAPPVYSQPGFTPPNERWNTPSANCPWEWQGLPDGLVWRSYLAGVKEPRFALVTTSQSGFGAIWDATIGARFALFRYGTRTAYRPEGFEVQLEGAAMPRLQPTLDSSPLVATDYRIGVPVVYAKGPWQFKTGYYHISSHLGDEYMILNPTADRINYVRDSVMFAVGYWWSEALRLYGEFDIAAVSDGAEPCEFQFGFDYSPPVRHGAPFLAAYGNLRQEVDFGGFFVVQTGWQWRGGPSMRTFRLGVEYLNGQSPQYEFFNTFEQHVGFGLWYDF
jgi:hypothetical protein